MAKALTREEARQKMLAYFSKPDAQYGIITSPYGGAFCMYLDSHTGRKCAIGCLIPKRQYRKEFDTRASVYNKDPLLVIEKVGLAADVYARNFMLEAQKKHDHLAFHQHPISEFVEWLEAEGKK